MKKTETENKKYSNLNRPRTFVKPIEIDTDNFTRIEPLGVLQNKEFSGIIPGISLIGDYHYYQINTSHPVTKDDVEMVGHSVNGITETKWVDQYTVIYGVVKSRLFDKLKVISEVREILEKIMNLPAQECDCPECQAEVEESLTDIAMESLNEMVDIIREKKVVKTFIKQTGTTIQVA